MAPTIGAVTPACRRDSQASESCALGTPRSPEHRLGFLGRRSREIVSVGLAQQPASSARRGSRVLSAPSAVGAVGSQHVGRSPARFAHGHADAATAAHCWISSGCSSRGARHRDRSGRRDRCNRRNVLDRVLAPATVASSVRVRCCGARASDRGAVPALIDLRCSSSAPPVVDRRRRAEFGASFYVSERRRAAMKVGPSPASRTMPRYMLLAPMSRRACDLLERPPRFPRWAFVDRGSDRPWWTSSYSSRGAEEPRSTQDPARHHRALGRRRRRRRRIVARDCAPSADRRVGDRAAAFRRRPSRRRCVGRPAADDPHPLGRGRSVHAALVPGNRT